MMALDQVAVSYIQDSVHFDKDIEVSTFEVNIRDLDILGIHKKQSLGLQ